MRFTDSSLGYFGSGDRLVSGLGGERGHQLAVEIKHQQGARLLALGKGKRNDSHAVEGLELSTRSTWHLIPV